MAVMAREEWTDERLDDLAKRMDRGFDESKVEIRDLRSDMNKGFDRVDADIREIRTEIGTLRSDTKKGFDEMNARFDAMQRMMLIGFVTLFAGIAASVIGGILATQL